MPASSGLFPALNLFPLNDSFIPKHIILAGGQRVKIGRQTNAKTVPGEKNGYFDSKVLSRQHAEVWEEGGKIYIKDVKSSNGTFINGTRLSHEGVESPPFELNTEDVVEFGIDIVGEDNQTIVHHKVAARVQCLLSQDDVNAAQQHAVYAQQAQQHPLGHSQPNHFQQMPPGQRRPSLHGAPNHQGSLGALAPMGRGAPKQGGLSFDAILSKLQSEVQRSRETSAELHSLTAAMSDIHDSLGGVSTQPIPQYPHVLPPVRQDSDPVAPPAPPVQEVAVINTLQEQLQQTQSLLSTHVEKIDSLGLESIVGEHDGLKREIGMLRDMIDQRKLETAMVAEDNEQARKQAMDEDDDDTRSVGTVMPSEQFDEDMEDDNLEARRRRSRELGRPRTPEPSIGLDDSDGEGDMSLSGPGRLIKRGTVRRGWDGRAENGSADTTTPGATQESVDRLTDRLEQLAAQFESAMEHSRQLQAKQLEAQERIVLLQAKVEELEATKEVLAPSAHTLDESALAAQEHPSIVANLVELTKTFEGKWERQREEWIDERERLRATKEEWERRVRRVEEDLVGVREIAAAASTSAAHASTAIATQAKDLASFISEFREETANDRVDESEFAPPSPRSISSDVLRRRKRSSARARGRSRSQSPAGPVPNGHAVEPEEAHQPYSPSSLNSAPFANGQVSELNGYNDGRRLPAALGELEAQSRSESMSSTSALSVSGRKSDTVIPYMSAVATLSVALIGVAAWTAANHIHA